MKRMPEAGPQRGAPLSRPDPFETLREEHERGLLYITILREAAEDIRSRGFSSAAFARIGEAAAFIDTEIRQHNEKEERFLLPFIEHYLPDSPVEMKREHRELWSAFSDLRRHVQDIEEGRLRGTAITDLVQSADLVAAILGGHIAREDEELFPAVKRLLSEVEYGRLAKAMTEEAEHEV